MDKITAVGLDLAKQIIQVHAIDATGRVVLRKVVRRERLLALLAQFPRCVVGMEACSGAHHWARELTQLGHDTRIMAAEFVRPFRKSLAAKNDANDAEAVCTAMLQPNMRFVTAKSVEQQALLCLHRVRQGLIEERTASINRPARTAGRVRTGGAAIGAGVVPEAGGAIGAEDARLPALVSPLHAGPCASMYGQSKDALQRWIGRSRSMRKAVNQHDVLPPCAGSSEHGQRRGSLPSATRVTIAMGGNSPLGWDWYRSNIPAPARPSSVASLNVAMPIYVRC
jgi:transposase